MGGWGGVGVSDNPNPHGTVEEKIYIVEPGRDLNPVKGGGGFLEVSDPGLEGFEVFFRL